MMMMMIMMILSAGACPPRCSLHVFVDFSQSGLNQDEVSPSKSEIYASLTQVSCVHVDQLVLVLKGLLAEEFYSRLCWL